MSQIESNPWSLVLSALAPQRTLIEWRLYAGTNFWMYAPAADRLTNDGINGTTTEFAEIAELSIKRKCQLGGLSVENDLDTVFESLKDIRSVSVESSANEVRIRLALQSK